jgi:hypothetical protein
MDWRNWLFRRQSSAPLGGRAGRAAGRSEGIVDCVGPGHAGAVACAAAPTDSRGPGAAPLAHNVDDVEGELAMDRNRVLLIGGALVLVLFLAYLFATGGVVPR